MALGLHAKYYSLYPLPPQSETHFSDTWKAIRIASSKTIIAQAETMRTKKKLKPSFFQQIRHKWSSKISSPRKKFPWQEEEAKKLVIEEEEEEEEMKTPQSFRVAEIDVESPVNDPVSLALPNRFVSAPWEHGNSTQMRFDSQPQISRISPLKEENVDESLVNDVVKEANEMDNEVNCEEEIKIDGRIEEKHVELQRDKPITVVGGLKDVDSVNEELKESGDFGGSNRAPWKEDKRRRNNTALAEKMIPEHELQRLRNISLRMLERIKVKNAGITQALVDSIHEKWKIDEVVKLKFEEPHSLNMKRTHEILEVSIGN